MPRAMPLLSKRLAAEIVTATDLARAGELIRADPSGRTRGRHYMTMTRLENLYEFAYLRVFLAWETFLEETFVRYLCGFQMLSGPPTLIGAAYPTLADARTGILGGRDWVSWYPDAVERRSGLFLSNGPHELVIRSNKTRLNHFLAIRHRIAHSSAHTRTQFDQATTSLAGRRYTGSSAGRFLRDHQPTNPTQRWLFVIGDELGGLASQISR